MTAIIQYVWGSADSVQLLICRTGTSCSVEGVNDDAFLNMVRRALRPSKRGSMINHRAYRGGSKTAFWPERVFYLAIIFYFSLYNLFFAFWIASECTYSSASLCFAGRTAGGPYVTEDSGTLA